MNLEQAQVILSEANSFLLRLSQKEASRRPVTGLRKGIWPHCILAAEYAYQSPKVHMGSGQKGTPTQKRAPSKEDTTCQQPCRPAGLDPTGLYPALRNQAVIFQPSELSACFVPRIQVESSSTAHMISIDAPSKQGTTPKPTHRASRFCPSARLVILASACGIKIPPTQRLLGLSVEDATTPLDTPEVVGDLKTRLFEGPGSGYFKYPRLFQLYFDKHVFFMVRVKTCTESVRRVLQLQASPNGVASAA